MSTQSERRNEPAPAVVVEERKVRPVLLWAAMGVVFLAVEAWTLGSWIFSPDFKPTPTGDTPVPGWMVVSMRFNEAMAVTVLLLFVYLFLIKPLRLNRKLTTDSLLFLAFFTVAWQDPGINYSQVWATYNTEMTNMGSWLGAMPGSLWPNAHMFPEPIVWIWFGYAGASFALVIAANWLMRKVKNRWPALGTVGMLTVCLIGSTLLFFVVEMAWLRMGVYTYAGSIQSLTLFAGHYYQYPIYEGVLGGINFAAWAALRYYRDDKGHTVAERGIDEIKVSSRKKTGIRFLALTGAVQAAMFFPYNVPHQWFALHQDPWPQDIQERSYFMDGLCGKGTVYACPGTGMPLLRPDSAYVTPEGELRPAGSAPRDGQAEPTPNSGG